MTEKESAAKGTMKDIAEALGVSVVTVSNALSGKKGVSEQKRAAIVAMAGQYGYGARYGQEKDLRSMTTGILIPARFISVGTSFYWEMYQHVAFALSAHNVLSSLEILQDTADDAPLPHCLQEDATDSLVIIGKINKPYLDRIMERAPARTVLLDYYDSDYSCSAILSDNRTGMYRATQHLIDHGHKEIGFVGTPELSVNVMERYIGYRQCMDDHGLPVNDRWVLRDRMINEAETPCIQLPETLPSSFACSSDYTAGFLSDALEVRGLHIPADISVVGYDDYLYNHPLGKHLTTFHVDMEKMAQEAVRLLQRKAQGGTQAEVIYVDSTMIERDSVEDLAENVQR